MTLDTLLLIAGGILAILGGGAVLLLGRNRYPSFLAGAALISLGLLQFGWARTVSEPAGSELWFELSLAFALPVSCLWVLLSRTLCLPPTYAQSPFWRVYIAVQALFAVAGLLFVGLTPTWVSSSVVKGIVEFPLRHAATGMVVAILMNLTLAAASFESTYLSLGPEARRAFRPGLLGILMASAYYGYATVASLATGAISSADIGLGWAAVAALAVLLPFSILWGRLTEVRVRRRRRPLTQTASLVLSAGFVALTVTLLWITHATGWSLARGLWVLSACVGALGIAGLAFSNRINRGVQRALDPILSRRATDRREIAHRISAAAEGAASPSDLCLIIPDSVREILGTDPVTLLVVQPGEPRYAVVASTLDPAPDVALLASEPLATELDRTRRAIHLRGRRDDLEYIPIYVENSAQITACAALCAAPILSADELHGILLCGAGGADRPDKLLLPMLDLICRRFSTRFDALREGESRAITNGP